MVKWKEMGEELVRFIRPATFPGAVKFVDDLTHVPDKTCKAKL
jgi:uncharacterized protein (DUF169 family)